MDDRNTLLIHHTHTPFSNLTEQMLRGFPSVNHQADYLDLIEVLDPDFNTVFTRTEHWRTDPFFYDDLEDEIEDLGGELEREDTYVHGELGQNSFAIINGVEASLEDDLQHVTLVGLPLEDEDIYRRLSPDELYEEARRAEWALPAHSRMPGHDIELEALEELLETGREDQDIDTGLGYPVGYSWRNGTARGLNNGGSDIQALAAEYRAPLLPEFDWHVTLPEGLEGAGLMEDRVFEQLENGDLPPLKDLDPEIIDYENSSSFTNSIYTVASFLDVAVPLYREAGYLLANPVIEKIQSRAYEHSLSSLEDLQPEYVQQHSHPL